MAAVAAVVVLAACGSGDPPTPATSATSTGPAQPTEPIPDSEGRATLPVPSGSDNPAKAWLVPDAAGNTDWVSAVDAGYLAAVRPVVPYVDPEGVEGTISNSTLIAIGWKACNPATSYEAGGKQVEEPQAEAIHRAALQAYC